MDMLILPERVEGCVRRERWGNGLAEDRMTIQFGQIKTAPTGPF